MRKVTLWGIGVLALIAAPAPTASAQDGATPKSLMVQVSTLRQVPPAKLREWFEHIRLHHRDTSKSDVIHNLILQDVADENGDLITSVLDVVDDYFGIFDNVFVGTAFVPYRGAGSRYVEGIRSSAFRWKNINASRKAMDAFIARYPRLLFHWYISFEAPLEYLTSTFTKNAYEAYLIQVVKDMHQRRPGTAIMWSPTFWSRYRYSSALRRNLRLMFNAVRNHDPNRTGINWLHWQDSVGKRLLRYSDVRSWQRFLAGTYSFASLRVNMEYFKPRSGGGIVVGDRAEHAARENYYRRNGIPVGASWEIRFWRDAHVER